MSPAPKPKATPVAGAPVGLTGEEAQRRRAQTGPNTLVDVAQHPLRRAFVKL